MLLPEFLSWVTERMIFLIRWGRSNGVNVVSKKQELAFKNINFVLSIRYPYGNVELTMYIFTCLVYGFFIYIIMPLWRKLIFKNLM